MGRLEIRFNGDVVFDRECSKVLVEQDIHGVMTASATYDPIPYDPPTGMITCD